MSYSETLNYAYKLLSFRDYSKKELRDKMEKKKYSQKNIDNTIKKLVLLGYLDDTKYAKIWIKSRIKNKPCGKILMIKGLRSKGISEEIIEETLKELLSQEKEAEMANILTNKKIRVLNKDLTKKKKYEKVGRFLQSKGFSGEIILSILEKIFQ